MDYKKTATDILNYVGNVNNVSHLEHCSTRLRFSLIDNKKVDVKALEKVPGVLGVSMAAQCQVIVGNNVVEIYDEILKLGQFEKNAKKTSTEKKKIGDFILDFIISIFQPIIPAVAGAGMLKAMLLLLSMLHLIDKTSQTFLILSYIGDAVFYFLPIMVAITTSTKLKVNNLVSVGVICALLLPNMTTLLSEGASFLSIPITNVSYPSQVFPAILSVIFYSFMEKFFTKISPKSIRIFFVPMVSLLVTVPITLLLLGPIGFFFGTGLTNVILFLFQKFGWIAVGLVAAILPFMIATGMHKVLVPYAISSITGVGKELLYLPASLAHNISQSGACFAVALRTKNTELKSTALSAGISALFGITEPALYGVTLQRKRVLAGVMISSFIGGLSIGLFGVAAFALVGPGLASISMYIDESNGSNFIFAIIGFVVSFVVSFVVTFILWKEDTGKQDILINEDEISKEEKTVSMIASDSTVSIVQPIKGEVIPLNEVKDDIFSKKILGDGFAVKPVDGNLYAPCDGEVMMLFDTKHSIALKAQNGAELLIHIGIDTVQLDGRPFEPKIKIGDKVKAGDLLIKFNLNEIKSSGFDSVIPVVITNSAHYFIDKNSYIKENNQNVIMEISKMEVQ
ncbi:beta-glucoside-specific PTS transporter subunit IIABC [Anaerosacchariphilus polymeriproducens]|uniref:PTS beta-glucoside transporter subunit IIBCA n=1 Tax=Anaerosacchariphilus polymeriproducens TaxID=1812858 RepID=A0A371AYU8_9FIRM|nr:beta-glucoside-specific PTS transporter subunit IIABC [Anaerosacchariphilus polymeriproducens]RDU24672.1 PTS beta-glucoside transporter subunit IIBCA [Anaerosacchariphilus polymeriproducens]